MRSEPTRTLTCAFKCTRAAGKILRGCSQHCCVASNKGSPQISRIRRTIDDCMLSTELHMSSSASSNVPQNERGVEGCQPTLLLPLSSTQTATELNKPLVPLLRRQRCARDKSSSMYSDERLTPMWVTLQLLRLCPVPVQVVHKSRHT